MPKNNKKTKKILNDNWKDILERSSKGESTTNIAQLYGVSKQTLGARLRKHNAALKSTPANPSAKILVMDIETAPIEAQVWAAWKQNVNVQQITSPWYMLTWSAKWLFSSEVMSDRLTSKEAVEENDSRLVKGLWKLFDEADIPWDEIAFPVITESLKLYFSDREKGQFQIHTGAMIKQTQQPVSFHVTTLNDA